MNKQDAQEIINGNLPDNSTGYVTPERARTAVIASVDFAEDYADSVKSELELAIASIPSGFRGSIGLSDPSPELDGLYFFKESGVYENFGDVVVDLSVGMAYGVKTGSDYSAVSLPYAEPVLAEAKVYVDKKTPWVTPEMFGAVADGVADDTEAVQAALDSGKNVILDGTYLIDGVSASGLINKSVVGTGNIKLKDGANTNVLEFSNCSYLRIAGFTIDGNKLNQSEVEGTISMGLLLTDCDNFKIAGVTSKNARANIYDYNAAITIMDCTKGEINHCSVVDSKYNGLNIQESTYITINGGNYDRNGYSGVQTRNAHFIKIMYVSATYNGTSNITVNGNDTDVVGCTGNYSVTNHGLNIGHDLTEGKVKRCNVIGGTYIGNKIWGISIFGGYNASEDATIIQSDITISGAIIAENIEVGIRASYVKNLTISNCIIKDNLLDGTQILNGDSTIISDCIIEDNVRYNNFIRSSSVNTKIFNSSYSKLFVEAGISVVVANSNPDNYVSNQVSADENKGFRISGNAIISGAGKLLRGVTSSFAKAHIKTDFFIVEADASTGQVRIFHNGSNGYFNAQTGNVILQSAGAGVATFSPTAATLVGSLFVGNSGSNEVMETVSGAGSPEGAITKSPGRWYRDSSNNELYFKLSGLAATGWRGVPLLDNGFLKNKSVSATIDFGSVPANSRIAAPATVALTGAAVGDNAIVTGPDTDGIEYRARVTAPDTVSIYAINYTTAPIDPVSGSFRISVIK